MRTGIPDGNEHWSDRMSLYLDGELGSADRARLEAHVTECAACAVALAELREVVAHARALEDRPPSTDLWPAIEARLEPRAAAAAARRGTIVDGRRWWAQRFDLALPQLAAAAVLLVILSGAAVWLAVRGPVLPGGESRPAAGLVAGDRSRVPGHAPAAVSAPAARPGPTASAAADTGSAQPGTTLDAVPVSFADARYDAAVAELERTLAEGRGKLDPRTLAVVEQNLRIIDRAIADAQRAVAADPRNTWLRSHLAENMKRKVDLLRSATLLTSAQG